MNRAQLAARELRRALRPTRRPLVVKTDTSDLYRVYVYHEVTESHIWLYTLPKEAAYRVATREIF